MMSDGADAFALHRPHQVAADDERQRTAALCLGPLYRRVGDADDLNRAAKRAPQLATDATAGRAVGAEVRGESRRAFHSVVFARKRNLFLYRPLLNWAQLHGLDPRQPERVESVRQ